MFILRFPTDKLMLRSRIISSISKIVISWPAHVWRMSFPVTVYFWCEQFASLEATQSYCIKIVSCIMHHVLQCSVMHCSTVSCSAAATWRGGSRCWLQWSRDARPLQSSLLTSPIVHLDFTFGYYLSQIDYDLHLNSTNSWWWIELSELLQVDIEEGEPTPSPPCRISCF